MAHAIATRNSQLATRNSQLATKIGALKKAVKRFSVLSSLRGAEADVAIQKLDCFAFARNDGRGFTLVELSIVLVIIGLLIGGILVGQSLIELAKINKEVNRLSQYVIAVVQFEDKFKQEAGDTTLFPNPGNNDGDNSDTVGTCPTSSREQYSAWSHLSQSGMLSETYTYPNPGIFCAGWVNGNGAGFEGVTPTHKITASGFNSPMNYFQNKSGINYAGRTFKRMLSTSYDPEMLWAIENKLDDGIPESWGGNIGSETSGGECDIAGIEQTIVDEGEEARYCSVGIYFNDSL